MASSKITRERVLKAVDKLIADGRKPTLKAVRQELGSGSYTTISLFLKEREATLARGEALLPKPFDCPDRVWREFQGLWQNSLRSAKESLREQPPPPSGTRSSIITEAPDEVVHGFRRIWNIAQYEAKADILGEDFDDDPDEDPVRRLTNGIWIPGPNRDVIPFAPTVPRGVQQTGTGVWQEAQSQSAADPFDLSKPKPRPKPFPNLHIIDHPLVKHKLTLMREKECSTFKFRALATELARLMAYEATRDFPIISQTITAWNDEPFEGVRIKGRSLTLVPILRAGLGMLEGVLDLIPTAKISVVGLFRNEETLHPVPYFDKFVHAMNERSALILDPMLATGGSMNATIDLIKSKGCVDIRAIVLVAAPEGAKAVHQKHPDIPIYAASLDDHLNEHGYIIPGLGDAGDKIFGTKQLDG